VGITSADYALADTGSLVMIASPREARLVSLLPPAHIAVVPRDRILTGLDELFSILPNPADVTSSMVLITGPSRTADIEQILVRGVHGPGQITVVVVHTKNTRGKLLLARYVPVALGEQLVEAGICFADDPGNVHLQLGSEYNWTVLGKREPVPLPEADRTTPATIQLLFQFATEPQSAKWPVRDLAGSAGIGKTRVAQIRSQFVRERVLKVRVHDSEFRMTPEIVDRLVAGYSQILRPKILLGRYRYQEQSVDQFVARLTREAASAENTVCADRRSRRRCDATLLSQFRGPRVS
jgi:hypothetical protein